MGTKITALDFFSMVEMFNADRVKLKMALLTQKKIVGLAMGDQNYADNDNPFPDMLSGVKIIIDEAAPPDTVFLIANYTPHSKEFIQIEIV
ncbi:MAG: hypothetical protein V4541_02650 [Bacteroidota bacterium]